MSTAASFPKAVRAARSVNVLVGTAFGAGRLLVGLPGFTISDCHSFARMTGWPAHQHSSRG